MWWAFKPGFLQGKPRSGELARPDFFGFVLNPTWLRGKFGVALVGQMPKHGRRRLNTMLRELDVPWSNDSKKVVVFHQLCQ
jgi:hypothetical protein